MNLHSLFGTVGEMEIIGRRDVLNAFILPLERRNKGQRSEVRTAGLKRVQDKTHKHIPTHTKTTSLTPTSTQTSDAHTLNTHMRFINKY